MSGVLLSALPYTVSMFNFVDVVPRGMVENLVEDNRNELPAWSKAKKMKREMMNTFIFFLAIIKNNFVLSRKY